MTETHPGSLRCLQSQNAVRHVGGRPGKWDISVCQVHADGRQSHEGKSQSLFLSVSVQGLKAGMLTRQCQYSLIPRPVGLGMRPASILFKAPEHINTSVRMDNIPDRMHDEKMTHPVFLPLCRT